MSWLLWLEQASLSLSVPSSLSSKSQLIHHTLQEKLTNSNRLLVFPVKFFNQLAGWKQRRWLLWKTSLAIKEPVTLPYPSEQGWHDWQCHLWTLCVLWQDAEKGGSLFNTCAQMHTSSSHENYYAHPNSEVFFKVSRPCKARKIEKFPPIRGHAMWNYGLHPRTEKKDNKQGILVGKLVNKVFLFS